jgi:hypothetical protein
MMLGVVGVSFALEEVGIITRLKTAIKHSWETCVDGQGIIFCVGCCVSLGSICLMEGIKFNHKALVEILIFFFNPTFENVESIFTSPLWINPSLTQSLNQPMSSS